MRDTIDMVSGGSGCSKDWKRPHFAIFEVKNGRSENTKERVATEEVIVNIDTGFGHPP
jgi:hypothetical protein